MPDPSSQAIATIGGNLAENSGGVHCLKYGVTSNHVLAVEAVLITGDVVHLGRWFRRERRTEEIDLTGVLSGSEGSARIRNGDYPPPDAEAHHRSRSVAGAFAPSTKPVRASAPLYGRGIIPAGLEFMDRTTIDAVSSLLGETHAPEIGAILLCELDGAVVEVDELVTVVEKIARDGGAIEVRISSTEAERESIWRGRKSAFGAIGKIAKDYYCTDGTIPRGKLPEVLKRMEVLSHKYGLKCANCFHAGDGNLHPIIMYDAAKPGDLEKAEAFGADILRACVDVGGGVLSGEHGIGVEKRDFNAIPILRDRSGAAAAPQMCVSTPLKKLLTQEKSFRPRASAPNLVACTCMAGRFASPMYPGSKVST